MDKYTHQKSGISPIKAGIAGAAIGAGVATAATLLKDEKNRQKLKQGIQTMKEQAEEMIEKTKREIDSMREDAEDLKKDVPKALSKAAKKRNIRLK